MRHFSFFDSGYAEAPIMMTSFDILSCEFYCLSDPNCSYFTWNSYEDTCGIGHINDVYIQRDDLTNDNFLDIFIRDFSSYELSQLTNNFYYSLGRGQGLS